jgi:hypothetical protein
VHYPHSALTQDTEQLVASDLTAMLLKNCIQRRRWGGFVFSLWLSQSMENQLVQAIGFSAEYRGLVFHFVYQSYLAQPMPPGNNGSAIGISVRKF